MTTLASTATLKQLLQQYLKRFPAERSSLHPSTPKEGSKPSLGRFLATTSSKNLYQRKNFAGHITASAFILSADGESVLLLHHKSLDRWLQPGGHIDDTDASIFDAAFRETVEETGIKEGNLMLVPIGDSPQLPFDIDSHHIPANPKKDEAAHVHHDIRFLFQLRRTANITISASESNEYRWVGLTKLRNIEDHTRVAEKIIQLRITD